MPSQAALASPRWRLRAPRDLYRVRAANGRPRAEEQESQDVGGVTEVDREVSVRVEELKVGRVVGSPVAAGETPRLAEEEKAEERNGVREVEEAVEVQVSRLDGKRKRDAGELDFEPGQAAEGLVAVADLDVRSVGLVETAVGSVDVIAHQGIAARLAAAAVLHHLVHHFDGPHQDLSLREGVGTGAFDSQDGRR